MQNFAQPLVQGLAVRQVDAGDPALLHQQGEGRLHRIGRACGARGGHPPGCDADEVVGGLGVGLEVVQDALA